MINKEDLEKIAGVSFDSILQESYKLLKARKWSVTITGIEAEMIMWLTAKSDKIEEMVKSPFYNGNLQLVIPENIVRETASNVAYTALNNIDSMIYDHENAMVNDEGKTVREVFIEALKDIPDEVTADKIKDYACKELISNVNDLYNTGFECEKKRAKLRNIHGALLYIKTNLEERITQDKADRLNDILELDKKKVIAGQKTSKIVSRLLHMLDYPHYNLAFTRFSDLINENVQKGYYVVSLNFLDYLRMSDGPEWSSCHTTDPHNTRGLPQQYHGQYVQGCLSYANDGVTYITYFVDSIDDNPDRKDKIYRQCMHIRQDGKFFVRGRVYPQGNDGQTDIYKEMLRMFYKAMGIENKYKNIGVAKEVAEISTAGANYPDYIYNQKCYAYSTEDNDNYSMIVGAPAASCRNGFTLRVGATGTII